jgi:hypothetical protein
LWVIDAGILFVNLPGIVVVPDAIVVDVSDLAVAAAREVPEQPVVTRREAHSGSGDIVTATQQAQFLFEQGAAAGDVHEGMEGSCGAGIVRTHGECGIGRVRIGLVAQQHVEVGDPAGSVHQLYVDIEIINPHIDAKAAAPPQDGLVALDQARVHGSCIGERDVSLPTRPRP